MFFVTNKMTSNKIDKETLMENIDGNYFSEEDVKAFIQNHVQLTIDNTEDYTFGSSEIRKWIKQVVIPQGKNLLNECFQKIKDNKIPERKIMYTLNALQTFISLMNKIYKNNSQSELKQLIPLFKKTVFEFNKPVTNLVSTYIQNIINFEINNKILLDEKNMLTLLKDIKLTDKVLPELIQLNGLLSVQQRINEVGGE